MNKRKLKVGVVGFGKMGLLHAGIVNAMSISKLTAVADNAGGVLDTFKEIKPDLSIYEDFERMIGSEPMDAVFITSPTHLHVPMAMRCLERRIPFFVEKPLALKSSDASQLADAIRRRPLTNMVGYMARHIDTFVKAREILRSHVLGRLIHLRSTMYVSQLFKAGKGWRYERRTSGGGVLITQNSHLIDLLQWLFGPISGVSGHVKSWYSKDVEDFAHAQFEFASGLTGYMDTSWSIRHYRSVDLWIDVQAENGTLTITDDAVKVFLDDASGDFPRGWSVWRKPDLFRGVEVDIGGPEYTRQDTEFLAAVANGEKVECDILNALRVQLVIDAIYESAASKGKQVCLEREY